MHSISLVSFCIVLLVLIIVMILCTLTRKLTAAASLTAGAVGLLVYLGAGYGGLLLLGAFFIMGVAATSHQKARKAQLAGASTHPERRTPGQVLANGGVAAIASLLAWLDTSHANAYTLMMAASLASATADTLSSELGVIYGRRHYNILSFKKEQPGPDGVVSMEGTLLGAAGALIIALLYAACFGANICILYIAAAGILGNLADSILGASLERKQVIGNNTVNLLNTLFAALVAGALYLL
ncbi:DUF92 domain-containing protein [Chitinophaga vietnamensis]|uniref:DUF92 domain-containing protein n=1 Tax=Chitinophaga vietnamensis TaxID=2593957 RepID=UPI00117871D3|nr:DUF92 domain-containing protein [Chitinophaga vietnamensis]